MLNQDSLDDFNIYSIIEIISNLNVSANNNQGSLSNLGNYVTTYGLKNLILIEEIVTKKIREIGLKQFEEHPFISLIKYPDTTCFYLYH